MKIRKVGVTILALIVCFSFIPTSFANEHQGANLSLQNIEDFGEASSLDMIDLSNSDGHSKGEMLVTLEDGANVAQVTEQLIEDIIEASEPDIEIEIPVDAKSHSLSLGLQAANDMLNPLGENGEENEPPTVSIIDGTQDIAPMALVKMPESLDITKAMEAAEDVDGIKAAQPNYVYQTMDDVEIPSATSAVLPLAAPNDPLVGTGINQQYWVSGIGSFRAWDLPRITALPNAGQPNAPVVAVLDTGCALNHPDMASNLDANRAWDVVNNRPITAADPDGGDIWHHGTFASGVISAVANNNLLCAGVGFNKVKTLPIRVFYREAGADPSSRPTTNSSTLLRGLVKVLEYNQEVGANKIRVINMSLGSGYNDDVIHQAIRYAADNGVVTVGAAGNDSSPAPTFPSDYDEVISVTAIDRNNNSSTFTNYGDAKDICAPGTDIVSLTPTGYGRSNGTSFATPMISGVAALMFAINPNLTVSELKDILYRTATDLGPAGKDQYYGWGKLAFEEAILACMRDTLPNNFIATIPSSVNSNMIVDVQWAQTGNSVPLQVYASNYTPAQRYRFARNSDGFFTITNINSGRVVDLASAGINSGATIQQYDSNGTNAQRWLLDPSPGGTYTIRSKVQTHYVFDIQSGNVANGSKIQLWHNNNTTAQRFLINQITPTIASGTYTVASTLGQTVMDIAGASIENGANLQTWDANNTLAQQFRLTYDTMSGYYTIIAMCSGKSLDVRWGAIENGTNVQQYDSNGSNAQKWVVTQVSPGVYTIYVAGGFALDVAGASPNPGANIWIYTPNNTNAQRFIFRAV